VWAVAAVVIATGWVFIAWSHRFHVTVPVAVLSLGWLAVVAAVYTLFRTGVSASDDDVDTVAWWRPTGKRDELEREKRSLLKAIKEIEFDREMGKISEPDALELIRSYRIHAIEVIKAIDEIDAGGRGSVRDEIEREVRARLAVGVAAAKRKANGAGKGKLKTPGGPAPKSSSKESAS
jgi:hypothetical protein